MSPAALPEGLPDQRSARRCLPSRGSRGSRVPPFPGTMRREDDPCPSRGASLLARFPIPGRLPAVRGVPCGRMPWVQPPGHARACGPPVPPSGHGARRPVVLPRSRVAPGTTCPALSPRWSPAHAPLSPTGLWPAGAGTPSALASLCLRLSCGPRLSLVRGSMTRPASSLAPAPSAHSWAGTWRSLLTCWRGVRQVGLVLSYAPTGYQPPIA